MITLRPLISVLALAGTVVLMSSCAHRLPTPPPLTQLQIREIQTRSFDISDDRMVQKAVINLLQDEGFIVKNAQPDLGLVVAEKQEPIAQRESDTSPILIGIAVAAVVVGVAIALAGGKSSSTSKGTTPTSNKDNGDNDAPPPPKPVATRTEITVNVTTNAKSSVVRFSAQRSVMSDRGSTISVEQVLDSEYYQRLFSHLDKSLFLQRSGF